MNRDQQNQPAADASRRDFLTTSAAVLATTGLVIPAVHAGADETLKIGLVGCGGRGTGAARFAMEADNNVKLVAMGDAFRDKLEKSKSELRKIGGEKFAVQDDHCFVGFDNFKKVIDVCDVVLLATPPHFRPEHLQYAVEKGKHVFCEKPVAVDGPGVRSVIASCEEAKKKGLSIVSGLCYRYHNGVRELMKRIHGGEIGRIINLQVNYNAHGLWSVKRTPEMSDMEWQLRNWLYFTWLSGDHNVEQHVHSLDKAAWAMQDKHPIKAVGMGGRQSRTDPQYGHIFDHHAVVYEYDNGVRCFSFCRQQDGTASDDSDWVYGSEGTAINRQTREQIIQGSKAWRYRKPKGASDNMYLQEHIEHFASIRSGNPINNGDYMAKSTLMGIMGRMATYTGQVITWEQALNSKEDLTPPSGYVFGPLPNWPVAKPGVTTLALGG